MREPDSAPGPAPERIGPLARLPVFLDLAGKRAVVIGGTAAAAWKAELLAAAGARVEVYAGTLSDELNELVVAGGQSRRVAFGGSSWGRSSLAGAALVIADVESDEDARLVAQAARGAGVPVNVVDRPEFCQFEFGSIVNRSPVVVAISTAGAAPVLAQAIRRRIEVLLPSGLARWAALAASVRASVLRRLPSPEARRAFWVRFSEAALAGTAVRADEVTVGRMLAETGAGAPGRVTVIDIGTGKVDLLPIAAVRALQSADLVVHDRDVGVDLMDLARREAQKLSADAVEGDLLSWMHGLVRGGRHVVRLGGADARLEYLHLERAGVAVEFVPGIAMPELLGRATFAGGQARRNGRAA